MESSTYRNWLLIGGVLCLMVSCASAVSQDGEALYPITQKGKLGFIDKTGKIVISPQFDSGFIDEDGCFSEGLATVQLGDKWGFIDKTGKFVIPPKFKGHPSLFYGGLAVAETEDGRSGLIDRSGEFVEAFKSIERMALFSEGLAMARKGDKYGYVDKTGKFVIEPRFADAGPFEEGLAKVKVEDTSEAKYGFIDKTGKMAIEPQFSDAEDFSEGFSAIDFGEKKGYINKSGKVVIAPQFDLAYPFSEGLAKVVIDGKAGFIDGTGKIVIAVKFEEPRGGSSSNFSGFKEGLAVMRVNNKAAYIDKTGKIIIALKYHSGRDFNKGVARIIDGDEPDTQKLYYIDKAGEAPVNQARVTLETFLRTEPQSLHHSWTEALNKRIG